MANVSIQIALNGGEPAADGLMRFDPGGVVTGIVQVLPQENINATGVRLLLEWQTRGPGGPSNLEWGHVATVALAEGALKANQPIYRSFNLKLPSEPWSFTGHIVSIIWFVVVTISFPLALDIRASQA